MTGDQKKDSLFSEIVKISKFEFINKLIIGKLTNGQRKFNKNNSFLKTSTNG